MSRREDDDTDEVVKALGQFMVFGSFVGGFGIWAYSRGIFNEAVLWLVFMSAVALGMRLAGRDARRELAERRKEAWDRQTTERNDQEKMDACRRRRERRDAIRAGEIENDGLSDIGRELAQNPEFANLTRRLEAHGVDFPSETEDIFESEKRDQKLEAAWKRKVAADAAWEKLR